MGYKERKVLYEQIEEERDRPLISYVTSIRPNAGGNMSPDVLPFFIRQIQALPLDTKKVDLLVVSLGGEPMVPWRIISMLREKVKEIGVLVPYVAYSAATLLALGADEIVMHPFANLGPVDPQINVERGAPGQLPHTTRFAVEDLRSFFEFVRTDVGISDQTQLGQVFELLSNDIGPVVIGAARRSVQLTVLLGEKLLHSRINSDTSRIQSIVEQLSRSYHNHGYPLGPKEVRSIGLPVVDTISPVLETAMWGAWEDLAEEMQCFTPFNPLAEVLQSPGSSVLFEGVVQLPDMSTFPPNVQQQVMNQVLSSLPLHRINPVDYDWFQAVVESPRARSEYHTTGKLQVRRLPDGTIEVNNITTQSAWGHRE